MGAPTTKARWLLPPILFIAIYGLYFVKIVFLLQAVKIAPFFASGLGAELLVEISQKLRDLDIT